MLYGELPRRAYDLQKMLAAAYEQASKPGLSWSEQRALDKKITAMECELENIIGDTPQQTMPGGYYTEQGYAKTTGTVVADPALVLAAENIDEKKNPFPWIVLALIAAGTTYYTIKG